MIDPALVVGILAGVVAIFGYTITNAMNRIERRSRIYADAILALVQFQDLPFRVRRRSDSSDATRTIVGQRVRDVQEATLLPRRPLATRFAQSWHGICRAG